MPAINQEDKIENDSKSFKKKSTFECSDQHVAINADSFLSMRKRSKGMLMKSVLINYILRGHRENTEESESSELVDYILKPRC